MKQIRKPVYVVVQKFIELGNIVEIPIAVHDKYEDAESYCKYMGQEQNIEICKRWIFIDSSHKYETASGESLME